MLDSTLPRQQLIVLFVCQAFYWSAVIVGVAFAGLVGLQLASHQSLATLPMAALTVGNIIATVPLSLFMQRCGRRAGFWLGSIAMIVAGGISTYAIFTSNFWLFCFGSVVLGFSQASAFYYRLAAADNIPLKNRGKAVSFVFSGGIVAALIAPTIGIETKDMFLPYEFAGAFLVVIILGLLTSATLAFFPVSEPSQKVEKESGRPLREILKQSAFWVAIINTAVSNSVMILIMVASPLAMLACGFSVGNSTSVIQWHVLGMFLPSFFAGRLIDSLGVERMALIGVTLLLFSAGIAIADIMLVNFYAALFFLGVGWNFLYLSGTTMMTACHQAEERGKVQGFAEFFVALISAGAALGSGLLLNLWGWSILNGVVVVILVLTLAMNVFQKNIRNYFQPSMNSIE